MKEEEYLTLQEEEFLAWIKSLEKYEKFRPLFEDQMIKKFSLDKHPNTEESKKHLLRKDFHHEDKYQYDFYADDYIGAMWSGFKEAVDAFNLN